MGIGIAIRLRDEFSAQAARVERSLVSLRKSSSAIIDSQLRSWQNTATSVAAISGSIAYGFYNATKNASEFGHRINQVDILTDGQLGSMKALGKAAKDMSRDFATNPIETTMAMVDNARAGITKGMEEVTKYQLAVSKATGESVQTIAPYMIGTMNAYQLGVEQFARVANGMTAAANISQSSIESLGETMKQAGFALHKFNVPFEKSLAMMAYLSQSNITGSQAGTYLKNMALYLGASARDLTPKKEQAWKTLGLDPKEVAQLLESGDAGMFQVIEAIDKSSRQLPFGVASKAIRDLVNMRGSMAIFGLTGGDRTKALYEFSEAITEANRDNLVIKQAQRMMDDPYSQFQKTLVEWKILIIDFTNAASPFLMGILKFTQKILQLGQKIADSPIGSMLSKIVSVGAPLVAALAGLQAVVIATTFAFTGMVGRMSMGLNLSSLLGAKLGSIIPKAPASGYGVLAHPAPGYLGTFGKNVHGNWYVRAGQTANIGGRLYGPGAILPRNFNPATGGWFAPGQNWVAKNSAGRYMVRGGYSVMMGGKTLSGGNVLPKSFTPDVVKGLKVVGSGGFGVGVGAAAMASGSSGVRAAAAATGNVFQKVLTPVLGKALPILTKIGGALLRFLPILGWGITLLEIGKWVYRLTIGQEENIREQRRERARRFEQDMDYQKFKAAMVESLASVISGGSGEVEWSKVMEKHGFMGKPVSLKQDIYLNVNGQQVGVQTIQQDLDSNTASQLPFNFNF